MFPATTKGSGFGFPDVCHTPAIAPPIPVPYPNPTLSQTNTMKKGTASKVSIVKKKVGLKKSMGDAAGVKGGLASGMMMGGARGPTSLVTHLIDYHHGQFIPRDSGLVCQMPTCSNSAEAYLPKTGQPVCLQCYKTETKGSYPTPSVKVPVLP